MKSLSSFMTFNPKCYHYQGLWSAMYFRVIHRSLGGCGCYTGLDLLVAFDHRSLSVQSCNLTTFQTLIAFTTEKPSIGIDQPCSNLAMWHLLNPTRWDAAASWMMSTSRSTYSLWDHWRWVVYINHLHGTPAATTSGPMWIRSRWSVLWGHCRNSRIYHFVHDTLTMWIDPPTI